MVQIVGIWFSWAILWSTGLHVAPAPVRKLRYARGQLGLGEPFVTESIIGTRFTGSVIAETQVGSGLEVFPALIPKVSGSAYITGYHQFVLDGEDPFPEGFRLTD